MSYRQFPKIALLFLMWVIVPVTLVEIMAQIIFSDQLVGKSWIKNNQRSREMELLHETHQPNLDIISISPFSSSTTSSYSREVVDFQTDRFGTIRPSSLEDALNADMPFVFFCGGSTLENWAVSAKKRITSVFSNHSNLPAVNSAKSGKDIFQCIKTIEDFFGLGLKHPKLIVIANNVNTLMSFGEQQSSLVNSRMKVDDNDDFNLKSSFRYFMPGWHFLAHKVKYALFSDNLPIEDSLTAGCCHGASEINKFFPTLKWNSNDAKTNYKNYCDLAAYRLLAVLNKFNFPLNQVVIFEEPNSFDLPQVVGRSDFRQRLHSHEGKLLTLAESSSITSKYDRIYRAAFQRLGFKVVSIDSSRLDGNFFYDAVHTTNQGAEYVGKFLSEALAIDQLREKQTIKQ